MTLDFVEARPCPTVEPAVPEYRVEVVVDAGKGEAPRRGAGVGDGSQRWAGVAAEREEVVTDGGVG